MIATKYIELLCTGLFENRMPQNPTDFICIWTSYGYCGILLVHNSLQTQQFLLLSLQLCSGKDVKLTNDAAAQAWRMLHQYCH